MQGFGLWLWNDASQFQLHADHVDQRGNRRPSSFNHKMRRFTVQRIALGIQIAQAAQGVGHLQQRPADIVAEPAKQLFRRRAQVDHMAAVMQALAVGCAQHRTATG